MKHNECLNKNFLTDYAFEQVKISNTYCENAFRKEIEYLKAYEADKLLAGFRETRGIEPKAEKYPGWESTEIRGHIMGHYLTAMSQAYANTSDSEILSRLNYIVDELKLCQMDKGYLSAFPEELFDHVENKKPAWVPWYTMHKIIAGLISVYQATESQIAYDIVTGLGDWVYARTSKWSSEIQDTVLSVEYGGMNDCLYELYKISKSKKHLTAARMFDEISLFTPIQQGKDILNNKHANTTIPKFLGALNRYLVLGDTETFYLQACQEFWRIVTEHHSYVTGGNSEWEHFGKPDILDAERTNCNCETCNTYNMLKLSRKLFKITKDVKYADYYENTIINSILSSQNPQTGMTMYFQPMATGYFKTYSTPFDKFWCCTGTGMENFTKLNDSIYFHDYESIFINQYISSMLTWAENNVKLTQITDIPNTDKVMFMVNTLGAHPVKIILRFRIPNWISADPIVILNGKSVERTCTNGYVVIGRVWSDGDRIELILPMKVSFSCLPDNHSVVAFRYGPVVLSAGLGDTDMMESSTGVNVTIPTKNIPIKDFITVSKGNVSAWLSDLQSNLVKTKGKLEFTLKNTDEDNRLRFIPHYQQYRERYGIYWSLVELNSQELKQYLLSLEQKVRAKAAEVDVVPVGNDQYELQHHIQGVHTAVDTLNGHRFRYAYQNGWFSYEMAVDSSAQNYLSVKYCSEHYGTNFLIYIDGKLLTNEPLQNHRSNDLYDTTYVIPAEMIAGKSAITIKFVPKNKTISGGIFDILRIVRNH